MHFWTPALQCPDFILAYLLIRYGIVQEKGSKSLSNSALDVRATLHV